MQWAKKNELGNEIIFSNRIVEGEKKECGFNFLEKKSEWETEKERGK